MGMQEKMKTSMRGSMEDKILKNKNNVQETISNVALANNFLIGQHFL